MDLILTDCATITNSRNLYHNSAHTHISQDLKFSRDKKIEIEIRDKEIYKKENKVQNLF